MLTFEMYFSTIATCCFLVTLRSGDGAAPGSGNYGDYYRVNIDGDFIESISRHYYNHFDGTHVVLLAEKSAAPFYNMLYRSFDSAFYIHSSLAGNFSVGDYCVLYVDDERFFFEETTYDHRFWHTTKTYLIVSENKLKFAIIWPYVQRIWESFKVFKISLLHLDELKVMRVFEAGFYRYANAARQLNYGVKDVKRYPLKVVIFPRLPSIMYTEGKWIGPDWETLNLFIKRMNFTLQMTVFDEESGFGSLENDTYTGVLAEVAYNRADVSFNSRFIDDPMIEKPYRYTKTNHLDSICFVVPQAESLTRMQIVWKTFTFEVWLCMAVTYVLMTNSFQFFNKFNLFSHRKISDPFMTSLQVVLGMGVYSLPKHAAGRLSFVSCSAAFFVIVSLFQASMVTRLSIDNVQNEIDTLEELDQSGFEIRTSLKAVRDSLAMYSYTKSLADKIDTQKDRRYYVGSKFVFMSRVMYYDLSKMSNYIGYFENKSIALHVVRECPLKYYLTYPVALDFPFLDELNDLLIRLQESGLSSKWRADIQKVEQEYYTPLNVNTSKDLKAYSMNDLWFAFVFLFVGYTVSMVVLVFELVLEKIKK